MLSILLAVAIRISRVEELPAIIFLVTVVTDMVLSVLTLLGILSYFGIDFGC